MFCGDMQVREVLTKKMVAYLERAEYLKQVFRLCIAYSRLLPEFRVICWRATDTYPRLNIERQVLVARNLYRTASARGRRR
jgi:hypothetical protein